MTTFIGSDDDVDGGGVEQIKRSRDMDLFCGHCKIFEHDMIMFGMNEYLENWSALIDTLLVLGLLIINFRLKWCYWNAWSF